VATGGFPRGLFWGIINVPHHRSFCPELYVTFSILNIAGLEQCGVGLGFKWNQISHRSFGSI
jgi:hypothetical protein